MSIKLDWRLSDAPLDDDQAVLPWPSWRAPSGALGPGDPGYLVRPEIQPHPDQARDGRREMRGVFLAWRWQLVGCVVLSLAIALGLGLWYVARTGWQRVTEDIVALVRYEEQLPYQGEVALVLRVQDASNAEWILARAAQVSAYRPAPLTLPTLHVAAEPIHVQGLAVLRNDYVRADVYRRYVTPGGETVAYGLPQFYRRNAEGVWLRASPPRDLLGGLQDWQSPHLEIRYHTRDEAQALAPRIESLLAQTCRLWTEACRQPDSTYPIRGIAELQAPGEHVREPSSCRLGRPRPGEV